MVNCFALERETSWGGKTRLILEGILDAFENNPYSKFETMDLDIKARRTKYNRDLLFDYLCGKAGEDAAVLLEARAPYPVRASITLNPSVKNLQFDIDERYFREKTDEVKIIAYLYRLAKTLPRFCWGQTDAFREIAAFYAAEKLHSLPECFNYYLGWFSLIHRRGYAPFYNTAEIFKTGFYKIEKTPDDCLAMWAYPSLKDFSEPRNQRRIAEISRSLHDQAASVISRT